LTQFIELLASPEQYVCVYRDGEVYIDAIQVSEATSVTLPA